MNDVLMRVLVEVLVQLVSCSPIGHAQDRQLVEVVVFSEISFALWYHVQFGRRQKAGQRLH
jgi:hypothetical protein